MIRVVKQLCINSSSILEGELWEKTIFATASHIASFRSTFHLPRAAGKRSSFHVPRAAGAT